MPIRRSTLELIGMGWILAIVILSSHVSNMLLDEISRNLVSFLQLLCMFCHLYLRIKYHGIEQVTAKLVDGDLLWRGETPFIVIPAYIAAWIYWTPYTYIYMVYGDLPNEWDE